MATPSAGTESGLLARSIPLLVMAVVAGMLVLAARLEPGGKGGAPVAAPKVAAVMPATPAAPAETTAAEPANAEPAAAATEAAASTPAASTPATAAALDRPAVEKIVREYLIANPEVLLEVQAAYEAKQEAERTERMAKVMTEKAGEVFRSATAPTIANAGSDVTVVEFFDYNCGYCRRAIGDVAKLVDTDKKVKFVFKEFPIFGKDSEDAAKVAIAAKKQNKYWEVHKALFEHEGKHDGATALEIAGKLGLNLDQLKADMAASDTQAEIDRVRALAESLGIQGTPHFLIGDQVIPGAPEDLYDQMTKVIADVRQKGCKVC